MVYVCATSSSDRAASSGPDTGMVLEEVQAVNMCMCAAAEMWAALYVSVAGAVDSVIGG